MSESVETEKPSEDQYQLELAFRSAQPCVMILTNEEDEAMGAVVAAAVRCDRSILCWDAVDGMCNGIPGESEVLADTQHPAGALFGLSKEPTQRVAIFRDLAKHLEDPKTLRALRLAIENMRSLGGTVVLIDHNADYPSAIKSHARQIEISLPDSDEIESLVVSTLKDLHSRAKINAKLSRREMTVVTKNLAGLNRRQVRQVVTECVVEDRKFDADDLNHMLASKRRMLANDGLLEYIESPVKLEDVGGLRKLKRWLKLRERVMQGDGEVTGLRAPRGVLMLGVQGAGKSICAKAIAAAWQRPLLRMDPSALYDRYIGESERRLRDALKQAEIMSPVILWIDEIEKGFASAGASSNDGGLSRRMFGTLLTWMQEHEAPVFMVATANDIEALPPELLRKGRFDEIFFVDLPVETTRKQIFKIHLKQRDQDVDSVDINLLGKLSEGFSGAEIEQTIISGLHEAYADNKPLATEHIVEALRNSPPLSVTMAEKVQELRDWAKSRCVPAD